MPDWVNDHVPGVDVDLMWGYWAKVLPMVRENYEIWVQQKAAAAEQAARDDKRLRRPES
jgi:hypothetical protein